MSENILFLRDFDAEAQMSAEQEQALQDSFTREEFDEELARQIKVVREEAYEAGFKDGKANAAASIQSRQTSALEALTPEITGLTAEHEAYCRALEGEMVTFMRDLCEKLFPDLAQEFLEDRVRHEIEGIARRAIGSPWLEIRIPEGLGAISETLELPESAGVDVKIIEDPDLSGACVKARWRNGRSEYDFDAICEKITSLLGGATNKLNEEEA